MKKWLTVFLLLFIISGCSEFPKLGPSSVERAWTYYEEYYDSGNYNKIKEAMNEFRDVIEDEPDNAEAFNGMGWCYGIKENLSSSIDDFDIALQKESTLIDPYAGLAFVYSDNGQDTEAVDAAASLIQKDSLYQFGHIPSPYKITVDDVRLVKAKSLCNLGDFISALTEVKLLNPGFNCNVNTAEGREKLLKEIERLRGII
jgi:tetratricopeptide (TPR) repeat protein